MNSAWSPDGYTLVVSSSDGYCSVLQFSEREIGEPLAPEKLPEHLRRLTPAARVRAAREAAAAAVAAAVAVVAVAVVAVAATVEVAAEGTAEDCSGDGCALRRRYDLCWGGTGTGRRDTTAKGTGGRMEVR